MSSAASMIKMIEQKVEQLKILHKAMVVAENIGKKKIVEIEQKKIDIDVTETVYTFDNKKLGIRYFPKVAELYIFFEGELKISFDKRLVKAYLQDEWIEELSRVYKLALEQNDAKEKLRIEELKQNWNDETTLSPLTTNAHQQPKRMKAERLENGIIILDGLGGHPIDEEEKKNTKQMMPSITRQLSPEEQENVEKYVQDASWNDVKDVLSNELKYIHSYLLMRGWKVIKADEKWTMYEKGDDRIVLEEQPVEEQE